MSTPGILLGWFEDEIVPKLGVLRVQRSHHPFPPLAKKCTDLPPRSTTVLTTPKFATMTFGRLCDEVTAAHCEEEVNKLRSKAAKTFEACAVAALKAGDQEQYTAALATCTNAYLARLNALDVARADCQAWTVWAKNKPPLDNSKQDFCDKFFPGPIANAACMTFNDDVEGGTCPFPYVEEWVEYSDGDGAKAESSVGGVPCEFKVAAVEIRTTRGEVVLKIDAPAELTATVAAGMAETTPVGAELVACGSELFLRHLHALWTDFAGNPSGVAFNEFDNVDGPLTAQQMRRVWQRRMAVAVYFDLKVAAVNGLPRLGALSAENLFGLLAPVVERRLVVGDTVGVPTIAKLKKTQPAQVEFGITSPAELWHGPGYGPQPEDFEFSKEWPQFINTTAQRRSAQGFRFVPSLTLSVMGAGGMPELGPGRYYTADLWDVNPLSTLGEAASALSVYLSFSPAPHTQALAPAQGPAGECAIARSVLWWLTEQVVVLGLPLEFSPLAMSRGKAAMPFEPAKTDDKTKTILAWRALPTLAEMTAGKHYCDGAQWLGAAQAMLRSLNQPAYSFIALPLSLHTAPVPLDSVSSITATKIAVSPTVLASVASPWPWDAPSPALCLALPTVHRIVQGAVAHELGAAWCRDPLVATAVDADAWLATCQMVKPNRTQAEAVAAMIPSQIANAYGPMLMERLFGFLATAATRFPKLPFYGTGGAPVRDVVRQIVKPWAQAMPKGGAAEAEAGWAMAFSQLAYTQNNAALLPPDFSLEFTGIPSAAWAGTSTMVVLKAPWKQGTFPWLYPLGPEAALVANQWQTKWDAAVALCKAIGEGAECYSEEAGKAGAIYNTYVLHSFPSTINALGWQALKAFADAVPK